MKKIVFSNEKLMKIIYYILLSMLLLFIILKGPLGNMDELWNFSFAKNIHDGLVPYKGFHLISTPLSCFFNSFILYIDTSLISFRVMYFIYYLIILYLLDHILDKSNIKPILKYIIIFLIVIILVKSCYLDYNFLQIILILLLINLHLKNKNYDNHKLNIIIPLISGLTIINKQSSGLMIASINIILILLNKFYFKKEINYKFILKQITLTIIPTVIFILYLLLTKSINEFYDIAIIGLTVFSNKYISKIFLLEIVLIYIFIIIEMLINKKKIELWILFLYSLASISFVIPILDKIHASFTIVIPFIFLSYIINDKLKKININNSYIFIFFPIFIVLIITNVNSYITSTKNSTGIYKHIPTNENQQKVIKDVNNYVIDMSKEYTVYILDISATLFNLNINKYNKYFDMFMNGNFGIKGEKEIYKIIDSENQLLIINDISTHWQAPTKIINYVRKNYDVCDSIDYLTVYCKK